MLLFSSLLAAVLLLAPAPHAQDPLDQLEAWVRKQERIRRDPDLEELAEARHILGELRLFGEEDGRALQEEIEAALIGLAALDWVPPETRIRAERANQPVSVASRLGLFELARLLDTDRSGAMARRLELELEQGSREALGRRGVVSELLIGRYLAPTQRGLFRSARDPDETLGAVATRALVGWPDPAAHLFFLDGLRDGDVAFADILEHFQRTGAGLGPQARGRLFQSIGRMFTSRDWREAVKARRLLEDFPDEEAVPILIESLSVWSGREGGEHASRRVQQEIVTALKTRSRRSLGDDPGPWQRWWLGVRSGAVAPLDTDPRTLFSTAEFFGLRPVSDRVLFVLDISGSMDTRVGTDERTRFDAAVVELLAYLVRSGPETRFNVVLFNEEARRWRSKLVAATDSNLGLLRNWLRARSPDGGTDLVAGLKNALEVDRQGRFHWDRVEADTLVILSDEERTAGSRWDDHWLEPAHQEAQIVFHCIQIGISDSRSLEALARRTGGEFLRVGG